MRRLPALLLLPALALGCGPKKAKTPVDEKATADVNSGPDGKRSGARALALSTPVTDDVNFAGGDMTDWYQVQLNGKGTVLTTFIHWDSDASDVMIDVFDEFGKQISASPVRNKGAKQKTLLTPIDKAGTYYVRVTAPSKVDATVYTMEAKYDAPLEAPPQPVAVKTTEPAPDPTPPPPRPRHREPREPREPRGSGETVQGRIVSAYRDGAGLTLHLDKGSAAGVKPGMKGTVLQGGVGEDALEGGEFKIVQVLADNKSVAKSSLRSIGKNTRVLISLDR